MIASMLALAACGAAGALTYSFPIYMKAISKTPPVKLARTNLIFSLFVGSVTSMIFTRLIGFHWEWTIQPEPYPLAMVIGLGSNPLVPIVLHRLTSWAESFEGKSS